MAGFEIIYGTNPVLEVMRAGKRRCHEVLVASGRRGRELSAIEEAASGSGVTLRRVARDEVAKLANTEKHQGVAARCDPFPYSTLEAIIDEALSDPRKGFIVVLDGVTDPQNLGSIARTAHLMGVHGIFLPRDNAASVNPTVVKSSAGATEHLPISQVTNVAQTLSYIKDRGFWVFGAAGETGESLYVHDFKGDNVAIVLGAEGGGMRRLVKERCDQLLSIPMEGKIGSYNVSVAGALFMGEVARQRWLLSLAKTMP